MPDPIRGVGTPNPVGPASTPASTAATGSAQAADVASLPNSSSVAGSGADLADVGQTEALLQSIVQAASTTPGIDQNKVSELQQAISAGTYQVDPQSIAQKIVELENQLGTAGQLQ
jgi:negative regulator of flagellin synthesis FlgM